MHNRHIVVAEHVIAEPSAATAPPESLAAERVADGRGD